MAFARNAQPTATKESREDLSLLNRLAQIGISLSAERNIDALLEKIVDEASVFTNADGVTLYLVQDGVLHFSISHNNSLGTKFGGVTGKPISYPPVPMDPAFVSGYAAIHKETVNIPDVYKSTGFDFTGPKKYDEQTGYRSVSMLVTPLVNHENEIIGVLQLLNAIDPDTGQVTRFHEKFAVLAESLASQAAVALNNFNLVKETERLFESFLEVMATGLDARSKYTHGHVQRVAGLTMELAEAINETDIGPYADFKFTDMDQKELKIAALMHDIGKIVSPPHIMDKSVKLETIFDRARLLEERYELIEAQAKISGQERKIQLLSGGAASEEVDKDLLAELEEIHKERDFVLSCNNPGEFMDPEKVDRLKLIADSEYERNGTRTKRLSEDEFLNLSIRKGSLNDEERQIMQDHIRVTIKMLDKIPFPRKFQSAPLYAASHHECLDGSGYPKGLTGEKMPVQSRMMCITDFLEALMATDRPYKKAMPIEKAFSILEGEASRGKLDMELIDILKKKQVFQRFIDKEKKGFYKKDL